MDPDLPGPGRIFPPCPDDLESRFVSAVLQPDNFAFSYAIDADQPRSKPRGIHSARILDKQLSMAVQTP
jgi:hypothetical protein